MFLQKKPLKTHSWQNNTTCEVLILILMQLQEIMVYFTRKLYQKIIILTFSQFDHFVILDKLI
jgi:uncharacterized MnhB-related membrane protein